MIEMLGQLCVCTHHWLQFAVSSTWRVPVQKVLELLFHIWTVDPKWNCLHDNRTLYLNLLNMFNIWPPYTKKVHFNRIFPCYTFFFFTNGDQLDLCSWIRPLCKHVQVCGVCPQYLRLWHWKVSLEKISSSLRLEEHHLQQNCFQILQKIPSCIEIWTLSRPF